MNLGLDPQAQAAQARAAIAEAKAAAGVREFSLVDADGAEHRYLVALHPAEQGERIVWALVGLLGGPLGGLLKGALGELLSAGGTVEELLARDARELLGAVDWGTVGRELAAAVGGGNVPTLSREILKFAHRDGKPLADRVQYSAAYQANYAELARALWEVSRVNRFLPGLPT